MDFVIYENQESDFKICFTEILKDFYGHATSLKLIFCMQYFMSTTFLHYNLIFQFEIHCNKYNVLKVTQKVYKSFKLNQGQEVLG